MRRSILRRIITPNVSVLIGPVFFIFIVIFLSFFLINKGYTQIKTEMGNLKTTRETENVLKTKLDGLNKIAPGVLDNSNAVVAALPEKNPSLLMVSRLRTLSGSNSLFLTKIDLKESRDPKEKLGKMQVVGEYLIPDYLAIVRYLKDITKIAPISSLEELLIKTNTKGELESEVHLSVYWSKLPTELPALTQPFKELTKEENELLTKVGNLTQPEYTLLSPSEPGQRENPFN